MKSYKDYTLAELLKVYKDIIGKDIEKITDMPFLANVNEINEMKKIIEQRMQKAGISREDENYKQVRNEFAFIIISNAISSNNNLNNNDNYKLALLSEIYRRYSKELPDREIKRLKETILAENLYAVYTCESSKYPGLKDYIIISKEGQEEVDSMRIDKSREIIMNCLEQIIFADDIESVMKSKYQNGVYSIIRDKLLLEYLVDKKNMNIEEFKAILEDEGFEELIEENENIRREFRKIELEYFTHNMQYIDKTSLLLNSALRVIMGIKIVKGEEIEGTELRQDIQGNYETQMEYSIEFLKEIRRELKRRGYVDKEYGAFIDNKEVIRISKRDIDDFLSRCTKKDYVTDREINEIHERILEGELTRDLDKRRIANIDLDDLASASRSYEEKSEEDENRNKILECSIELAEYLIFANKTTSEEILSKCLEGEIDYRIVGQISMPEYSEEYYTDTFKNMYNEMVYADDVDKQKDILQRFSNLYTYLEEMGKIEINRDNLIGDIIGAFGEDFASDILDDLYELKVINLEKAIEWVGSDILYKEYEKGNLKPLEVKRFYEQASITIQDLVNFISRLPDNGDRFMLIGSIFPEETEEEISTRELLINECLTIDSGIEEKTGKKKTEGQGKSREYYKHITDPFARISLIRALDEDYSFEMTLDGHAIIRLPNLRRVIIEKMLDKDKQPSYGAATYILDEEYYDSNSSVIKKEGRIDRRKVINDLDSPQVTRIIHLVDSWGKNIKQYFGQSKESKWSEEEMQAIDGAIDRIKRSERVVGE